MVSVFEKALVFLAALMALMAVSLFVYSFVYRFSGAACKDRWQGSGLNYKYSIRGGCFVEVSPGKWLSSKQVRYDLPKESS